MPKPKLTPEEKKALKLEKKAAKKLRAIENKKQLKRNYLEREVKYGNVTIKRHEKEWRQMLINIALPRMRNDLLFAWHNFERIIDCKDFTISLFIDEINDAEEQYIRNLKCHTDNIDKLIKFFRKRLGEIKYNNQQKTKLLQLKYSEEDDATEKMAADGDNYLKTMLYGLEQLRKEIVKTSRAEYFSKLDEEQSKCKHLVQILKGILEQKHLRLWEETKHYLDDYHKQTREKLMSYTKLQNQDDSMQILLKNQLIQLSRAHFCIKQLKQKLSESKSILGQKLSDLEDEERYFAEAFNLLKLTLVKDRRYDMEQFTRLTMEFNQAVTFLNNVEKKAELILQLTAKCRQLETLKEKVLPFPLFASNAQNNDDNEAEYQAQLDLFFQRVAQTDACRFAINEEREYLLTEHFILKKKIHQYCKCLSCPSFSSDVGTSLIIKDGLTNIKNALKYHEDIKQ